MPVQLTAGGSVESSHVARPSPLSVLKKKMSWSASGLEGLVFQQNPPLGSAEPICAMRDWNPCWSSGTTYASQSAVPPAPKDGLLPSTCVPAATTGSGGAATGGTIALASSLAPACVAVETAASGVETACVEDAAPARTPTHKRP